MGLTSIRGLDHVILLVGDLDRAEANFRKLGFALTPRGVHRHQPSQNHTAVFADNYLELLYYPEEERFTSRFSALPSGYEGLAAVALHPSSSDAVHDELEAMGLSPPPVQAGERPVETPDGIKHARWRNQNFPPDAPPLPLTFCCEHQAREAVYLPGADIHLNGAKTLAELFMVHPEPVSLQGIYARVFGAAAVTADAEGIMARPGNSTWRVLTPAAFARRFPRVPIAPVAASGRFVGAVVTVASLSKVSEILKQAGIAPANSADGGLVPPPEDASGMVLEFREG